MPSDKKRKRHKMATHKRKKRLRKNRHKKKQFSFVWFAIAVSVVAFLSPYVLK